MDEDHTMNNLVIFGTGQIAELAHYYFTQDSEYRVVAFTVDGDFLADDSFCGLPVIPFERVATAFTPDSHSLFVAVSYSQLNRLRAQKFTASRSLGYRMAHYVSSRAAVWAGFEPQENCFVLENNTIQPFATIGENVTLWSGNHIGHHSSIGNNCFITSHVVVSGNVTVGERCFLGVNATLRDGISLGKGCLIGAGTLLMRDAPADSLFKADATRPAKVAASQVIF